MDADERRHDRARQTDIHEDLRVHTLNALCERLPYFCCGNFDRSFHDAQDEADACQSGEYRHDGYSPPESAEFCFRTFRTAHGNTSG